MEMVATFPVSHAGGTVHVIPVEGVRAEQGWITEIRAEDTKPPSATARWTFIAEPREEPYTLTIHYKKKTYKKKLLVGQKTYAPGYIFYNNGTVQNTELMMRKVELFGVVPGIGILLPNMWNLFPPWLVAYLLIAVPFVFVVKRVFKIY